MKKNNCKNMIKECLAVSALLLALPLAVFGETVIGAKVFSIGPRAAYSTAKDATEGKWSGGAQARLRLSSALTVEGSIDYRRNDFSNRTTVKTYPVQASLLAYLMPGSSWSPFFLGGAGWYYTQVDGPSGFKQTNNRFGLHAGAGLEVMLNEALSMDASYRYISLESVTAKDVNALDKTYRDSGSMITIALNFLF